MSSKVQPATGDEAPSDVPVRAIPGSYGIPFLSPVRDRLDFFYFQGADKFFQSRIDKYGSTVFRTNMPPGPFVASNPRVVALLDAKSYPVLLDAPKVEKRDVFLGTYTPSLSLTGGHRVCPYLDPSEPKHAKLKQLLLDLLASRKPHVLPSFCSNYAALFDAMESQLAIPSSSSKADFNKLNDDFSFEFICEAYFGSSPSAFLGSAGPSKARRWLFMQLCPLATLGLPRVLEEIFLRTVPLPAVIARSDYAALYSYFSSVAGPVLAAAEEQLGLSKEEACHNLLFATVFNSYGGLKVLLPGILKWLSVAGPELHSRLVDEIRPAVQGEGGGGGGTITMSALRKMELTRSVVYEVLRIDPPVKFQYGKARTDLTVESQDAKFHVREGEMLLGYQPFCTRDARVFENGGEFAGDRFVGEEGEGLLRSLVWSNGPETESPTAANKQCAGKDLVVLVGRLLVAEFFLRYDTFTAEIGSTPFGAQVTVTSLTKASAGRGRAGDD